MGHSIISSSSLYFKGRVIFSWKARNVNRLQQTAAVYRMEMLKDLGRDRSRSLSRALPRPLLFTPACAFIFFQIFILCPISQGVGSEKRGNDNFSVRRKIGYLSITLIPISLLIGSIALINFVPSLLKPVLNALGSYVRARRYVRPWTGRGKMGKGPTSNASYPHINFQICQETVTIYNWSC